MEMKNIREQFEKVCCRLGCPVEVNSSETGVCGLQLDVKPALGVRIEDFLKIKDDIALQLGAYYIQIIPPGNGSWKMKVNLLMDKPAPRNLDECIGLIKAHQPEKNVICLGDNIVGGPVFFSVKDDPNILVVGSDEDGKAELLYAIESQLSAGNGDPLEIIHIQPESGLSVLEQLCAERDASTPRLVMIREYADLLRISGEKAEDCIAKLTLRPVSSGIYMVIATEYPAVDVVSGVIKYGFPTRISFRLRNRIESRTVIDVPGAESLAGPGEALMVRRDSKSPEWLRITERIPTSYINRGIINSTAYPDV